MTTLAPNPFWAALPVSPHDASAAILTLNSGTGLVSAIEPLACVVPASGDQQLCASVEHVVDQFLREGGRGRIADEGVEAVRAGLAKLIGGLDPDRFAGLRRFMGAGPGESQGARKITSRAESGILPEIIVDGAAIGRTKDAHRAVTRMMDLMFDLSLWGDMETLGKLKETLDFSGLLDCPRIHFTFAPKLPGQLVPCIASVRNPSLGFEEPCIRVHTGRKKIEPEFLLRAVLNAYGRARDNPSVAACFSSLMPAKGAPKSTLASIPKGGIARSAQEILITRGANFVWKDAIGKTGLKREARTRLLAGLKDTGINVSLRISDSSMDEPRGVSFSYREADSSRPEGDRRRHPLLAMNFVLPRRNGKPAIRDSGKLLEYIRKAALIWIIDGMPRRTDVVSLHEDIPQIAINRGRVSFNLVPRRVSKEWMAEMAEMLDWLYALKKVPRDEGRVPAEGVVAGGTKDEKTEALRQAHGTAGSRKQEAGNTKDEGRVPAEGVVAGGTKDEKAEAGSMKQEAGDMKDEGQGTMDEGRKGRRQTTDDGQRTTLHSELSTLNSELTSGQVLTTDNRFPGIRNLARFLDPRTLPGVLDGIPSIDGITVGDSIFRSVSVLPSGGRGFRARFVLDIPRLTTMNPLDLIDAAQRAVILEHKKFGGAAGASPRFSPIDLSHVSDRPWAVTMAWITLMWKYEQFLKKEDALGGGLNLSGSAAWQLSEKITRAVMLLRLTRPDLVAKSAAERGKWILEAAGESGKPVTQPPAWRADRVTILSLPRARLIHFNGEPRFSDKTWKKITEAILSSPEGVTWIDFRRGMESNRPELIWEEGDDGWYEQNRNYSRAALADKKKYRDALALARKYVAQFPQIARPAPTPLSTAGEIKFFLGAISGILHPDGKEKEVIDSAEMTAFFEAMRTLAKFHKGM